MPVLNNLLENREMNLDDGTHIIHPSRHALMDHDDGGINFIPAHRSFRVIALGMPVPPYKGYPLDPPFRSRFQARLLDTISSLSALVPNESANTDTQTLYSKLRDIILAVQLSSELRDPLQNISRSVLPLFPQNALQKLSQLLTLFPPTFDIPASDQLARVVLTLNPLLIHAPFEAWALLSQQFEKAGLGPLSSPSSAGLIDGSGFFGYRVLSVERVDPKSARVQFEGPGGAPIISVNVPAGPQPFSHFPPRQSSGLLVSNRFFGLLSMILQAHALGWDISIIPPVLPSTATCSTTLIIKTFAEILGYEVETIHLYKELGGRELLMRRRISDGGVTSWEAR